jgi:hypothetical protein
VALTAAFLLDELPAARQKSASYVLLDHVLSSSKGVFDRYLYCAVGSFLAIRYRTAYGHKVPCTDRTPIWDAYMTHIGVLVDCRNHVVEVGVIPQFSLNWIQDKVYEVIKACMFNETNSCSVFEAQSVSIEPKMGVIRSRG